MPWINGRHYTNALFGRALERAREASARGTWADEPPGSETEADQKVATFHRSRVRAGEPKYENPQNEREARLANIVYNETSSLRHNEGALSDHPGSADDLQAARVGIAEIANRALNSGHPERVAPSELRPREKNALGSGNQDAILAHNASLAAARMALAGANTTRGATQYRMRAHPNLRRGINSNPITAHFGPFRDAYGRPDTIVVAQ